ncbi:MAG TPA: fibrillarin-like rRNA/tRNA 2'-O-methyltransferase [Candidatus Bathyarchaeia archaeon]|nr:fibrillarin-like rRNA/tRNA 2'-O-methyltransferase [Candidatus Bathyarchaeia archaeon]
MDGNAKRDDHYEGVFWVTVEDRSRRLATKNLAPGISVYGETLVRDGEVEYRTWDAYRSKLAAAILRNVNDLPVRRGSYVLYLGSASGTTASHVSDIVENEGRVYCVEFAQRSMRELIDSLCQYRSNVYPILSDARQPEKYKSLVSPVDVIYSDVAQPEQAKILADNAKVFLKPEGSVLMAIKSRSVDVTMEPTDVFKQEIQILQNRGFHIVQTLNLEPYEKDHAMVLATHE